MDHLGGMTRVFAILMSLMAALITWNIGPDPYGFICVNIWIGIAVGICYSWKN